MDCVDTHSQRLTTPPLRSLDSQVRSFPEVDRVDTDEIYPTLSLTERQLGHWQESLSVVAEGWARMDLREAALDRGVIVWHMHALNGEIEKISLRRGECSVNVP